MQDSHTLTFRDLLVIIHRKLQSRLLVQITISRGVLKYCTRESICLGFLDQYYEIPQKPPWFVLAGFCKLNQDTARVIRQSGNHGSPSVIHDISKSVHEISNSLPKDPGNNVECLGIDNTRRKIIRKKDPDDNNLIRRKKVKKGFQVTDDNTFTDRAPPSKDFGVLEEYGFSYSSFWDVLTVYLSKDSIFFSSMNKLRQVKPSVGYLHSIANSGAGLNSLNWTAIYEASSK
ncbi:hypothetical protein MKX03_027903, partial [Papaver bracteatum]